MSIRSVTQQIGGGNSLKWRKLDDYSTPKVALHTLLKVEKFHKQIWEPFAGLGAISARLQKKGYSVYTSDIKRWKDSKSKLNKKRDFLNFKRTPQGKHFDIITNPPYGREGPKMVVHALKLLKKFPKAKIAMLLKLVFLEGTVKYNTIFKNNPPYRIYVYANRIPRMHRFYYSGQKSSSMVCFAWFVWKIGNKNPPEIHWLHC